MPWQSDKLVAHEDTYALLPMLIVNTGVDMYPCNSVSSELCLGEGYGVCELLRLNHNSL